MCWDVMDGYRHMYLHRDMIELLLFRYRGRYYRYEKAMKFVWGQKDLWLTKVIRPVVRYIRERLRYRVLPLIEDFLLA